MGFKTWLGGVFGEKEEPVYATPEDRNRKIQEYQTFLKDYERIYGKEAISTEFVANGENAPSYRLWLTGRDRGVTAMYNSLPAEVKSRFRPVLSLPPKKIAPLPQIYQELKAGSLKPDSAAYALGFDSIEGFTQVMNWLDALVQENLVLKQAQAKGVPVEGQVKKKRKPRGPNKKKPEPIDPLAAHPVFEPTATTSEAGETEVKVNEPEVSEQEPREEDYSEAR